jgi:hypothetical protein
VNLFQILAISVLLLLVMIELVRAMRRQTGLGGPLFRSFIWLMACGFILFPDTLTYIARWLGIGVGANLLLYLLALAFVAVSFLLYARTVQLRRQMTLLVRHLALAHPLPPAPRKE